MMNSFMIASRTPARVYRQRNPSIGDLRRWYVRDRQKSNRQFRRIRLSALRELWRRVGWDPTAKDLLDIRVEFLNVIENNALADVMLIEDERVRHDINSMSMGCKVATHHCALCEAGHEPTSHYRTD